jgi:hypothetical protein
MGTFGASIARSADAADYDGTEGGAGSGEITGHCPVSPASRSRRCRSTDPSAARRLAPSLSSSLVRHRSATFTAHQRGP